jgi:plastocyanin
VLACKDPVQGITVDFVAEGTAFSPTERTISGANIIMIWGFRDGPHNVTFEDGAPASGDRSSGTFQRDFGPAAAGTYRFRCTIHSTDFATGMVGRVIKP